MKVTSVDMYSATLEEAISFPLTNSKGTSRYTVRNILGLDAEEIVPKFYGRGLNGVNKFYDFGVKSRDIVLRLALNPRFNLGETYSDVRDDLYRTIYANRSGLVTLNFKSGASQVANIQGSIVKFEAVHFTQLPEVQITVRCADPMFKGVSPVILEHDDIIESNPIIIPDSFSTAPHGFTFQLTITAFIFNFLIQEKAIYPDWKFQILPDGGFLIGDVIYFSSEYNNKYIYMVRGGVTIRLASNIEPSSIWPIMFPGANSFHFENIDSFDFNYVQYYPSYWGV